MILLVPMFAACLVLLLSATEDRLAVVATMAIALVAGSVLVVKSVRQLKKAPLLGRLVVRLGFTFWFYLPAFGASLTAGQWNQHAAKIAIRNSDAIVAVIILLLFHLLTEVAYAVFVPGKGTGAFAARLSRWFASSNRLSPGVLVIAVIALAGVGIAIYTGISGSPSEMIRFVLTSRSGQKPWSSAGNYGTTITPLHNFAQGCLVVSAITGLYLTVSSERLRLSVYQRLLVMFVAISCVLWVSIDSGSRSTLLQMTLPPVLLLVYSLRSRTTRWTRSQRTRRYVAIVFLVALVIPFAAFQRAYRTGGELGSVNVSQPFAVQDNDFFTLGTYAVAIARRHGIRTHDFPPAVVATGPIPRVLWEDKPENMSMVVFSYYLWGVDITTTGRNTLPSIFGQAFLSWGWAGVILFALCLGWIIAAIDRALLGSRGDPLLKVSLSVILSYIFISFRIVAFGWFFPIVLVGLMAVVLRSGPLAQSSRRPLLSQ